MKQPRTTPLAGAIAMALALPLFTSGVHAQSVTGASGSDEVIVLGRRLEESIPLDLQQFGNRVEIITAEDLQLGGFNDLSQALQMQVPALYVAPKNGAFDYIGCSLQGSRCQDILWLVDGVRVNNRLFNTTAPLDTIPAHMVERIEVLYGGQGIFYGTQSVAGVVNIVTRSFTQEPAGTFALGAHGNRGRSISGDFRTMLGDGHQLVVYGSHDQADGFQPFRDQDYEPSGTMRRRGYDVTAAGVKYAYAFSGDSQITVHWHHSTNEVDFAEPSRRASAMNARDEDLITVKWDYSIGENIDLFLKGYFHEWDTRFSRVDNERDENGELTGNLVTISDREFWGFKDYGFTAMARIRSTHGLEYAVGYEGQRYSGRDDVLLIAERTEHVNALFGQIRTGANMLGGNTRLALGMRHNEPRGEGSITVGNFSALHNFSDSLYLRGGLGTSFRLPDAFQLYAIDECCAPGNPDLKGERSRNVDLALGGSADTAYGFQWEIGLFRREVRDLIGIIDGQRANTRNRVEFEGWELNFAVGLAPSVQLSLNYTDSEATPRGSSQQVADIPTSTAKVGLNYRPQNAPYDLGIAASHVGSVWSDVPTFGRVNHGSYTVVDLSAGFYFGSSNRQRLGLRLENLFDEEYATSVRRAFRDVANEPYAYWNLGTPRTAHLSYQHRF